MARYLFILSFIAFACQGPAQDRERDNRTILKTAAMETIEKINRTEEEWKNILTPQQYHVLREAGTDAPFTGSLTFNKEGGKYNCAGCGSELFTSEMKFDSHCGWPSFDREIEGGKVIKKVDRTHGMVRTEILCAKCGSHLGHLFDDGPTDTGMRYCVNSTSLQFKKSSD